ncbi:MAG: branched-chain amino acid ABC transporter permease [Oscillospiraceae bacterium]|nr:branched-chain amino acid ABC transporter permease [Oscillospiraceae bacterium]
MGYYLVVLTTVSFTLIAILSMYVLLGLTGIFSMGQAAFMSVGAYAAAMLATRTAIPMPLVLIFAVLAGMLSAFLVGLPVIRLRRDYIALITLGFGEAIVALLNFAGNITGGAMGIARIPRLMNLPIAVLILAICIFLVINFKHSKFGRHCIAIKNDEISAAAMGINVARIKLLSFVFAGGFTALAGAMFAYTTTFVEPMAFGVWRTIDWISIVFVGGVNSLTGSMISGIIFNIMPEALRFVDTYRIIIQCIIVLVVVNFLPRGFMGEFELWHLPKWLRDRKKRKNAGGKEA